MKLPGEELAIKIFESVVKGAGVFSRPWQIKREAIAKAEAERIRLLGQEAARLQIEKIRSGELQIDENLKLISHDTDEDADGVQEIAEEYISVLRKSDISPGRLLEVEHQINLEQISTIAIEEAMEEEISPDTEDPIDKDWFSQWRSRAKEVSGKDMQTLWARVLKGEAHKPGQFSVHTLDFLSRMSKQDAEKLSLLGQFAINGSQLLKLNGAIANSITESGLTFQDLINFESLGILSGISSGIGGITFQPEWSHYNGKKCFPFRIANKALLLEPKDQEKEVEAFSIISISFVGRELLKLADVPANLAYLKEIAEAKKDNYIIYIGDVENEMPDGNYGLRNIAPI